MDQDQGTGAKFKGTFDNFSGINRGVIDRSGLLLFIRDQLKVLAFNPTVGTHPLMLEYSSRTEDFP